MTEVRNESEEATELSLIDRVVRFKEQDFVRRAMLALPEWVTPNGVTVFRGVLMLPFLILVLYGAYWWALGLFLFSMSLDFVDGALAQAHEAQSESGAFLDPLVDKITICMALLALGSSVPIGWLLLACVTAIGSWLTYIRVTKILDGPPGEDGQVDIKARPVGKIKLITEVVAISVMLIGLGLGVNTIVWIGRALMST